MLLCHEFLKFQSAFARRIGESFYFAVILGAAAIEDDFVDFLGQEAFRDRFSHFFSRGAIRAALPLPTNLFHRPRGRESLAGIVIDDLRVDMLAGEMHARRGRSAVPLTRLRILLWIRSLSYFAVLPSCY